MFGLTTKFNKMQKATIKHENPTIGNVLLAADLLDEEKHHWSFTLELTDKGKGNDCDRYRYYIRKNGCVFLMTDEMEAVPDKIEEHKLQRLCDLLNKENFDYMFDKVCR